MMPASPERVSVWPQEVAAHPPGRTLATLVYDKLRADIVRCRLAPGARLRFGHLRRAYGVGISPLREALSRLTAQGFVTFEDQRGFRVAHVSAEELRDVTRVRVRLECIALRDSIANASDAWEEHLVLSYHRLTKVPERAQDDAALLNEDWEQRHHAFHRALIVGCASKWLLHFCDQLYDLTDRYRRLSASIAKIPRDVPAEHREIFEAALARDADRACAAIEAHFGRTADLVLAANPQLSIAQAVSRRRARG